MYYKTFIFIVLSISIGSSRNIKAINFDGNISIESSRIHKIIRSKTAGIFSRSEYNMRILHLDKMTIKNFYNSQGFLEAEIKIDTQIIDENWIDIIFKIEEGNRYFLNKIEFFGNKLFSDEKIINIINLTKGKQFNPIQLRNGLLSLKKYYQNNGKATINIVDEIEKNKNLINVRINIAEGETYYIGKIDLIGIKKTKERFIIRELKFKTGDVYKLDNILETQKRIFKSGIYSSVEINPNINSKNTKIKMEIKVREIEAGNITGEFGFGQSPSALGEGASPITILQSGGKWQLSNVLNTGMKTALNLNLGVRLDNKISLSKKKLEFSLFTPWLYRIKIPLNMKYYIEESTEEGFLRKQEIRTSLLYRSGERYRFNCNLNLELNQLENNSPIDEERSLELNYIYHNIDNYILPSSGYYFSASGDLRGTILGGSRHYIKLESEYRHYYPLYNRFVFASRFQVGFLKILKTENDINYLPTYDRLYLGGSTSMRGWDEEGLNPNGGKIRYLVNQELRFPLFWKIGGEIFIDAGKLIENDYDTSKADWDWNVGYGLNFLTPLGPMRIDASFQYGEGKATITNALLYIF